MKALVYIVLAGCALTQKAAPVELRYFSPEAVHPAALATAGAPRARVRLGRVTASAHLRTGIVHRRSAVELAPYDTLRWTEAPENYVRRSLSRALFEARPLEQAVGGDVATLDVELVAFEEIERGADRAGQVELRYQLHDDHRVLARGVVTFERGAAGPAIEPVVVAIGAAMEAAANDVADRVARALQSG